MIWPAIDLMGGRAVRLTRGEKHSVEDVGDPLEIAERWRAAGRAHVVDLDGAFAEGPVQTALIGRIARIVPVQAGGGVRHIDHVSALLDTGVSRVVIGTQAFADPIFLDTCLSRFGPEYIVVAADVKDGKIAARGWIDTFNISSIDASTQLVTHGVKHVLVTAVHRDGTLEGPDTDVLDVFHQAGLATLASGGIGSLADVRSTAKYAGTIIGKALYAARFTLAEALAC